MKKAKLIPFKVESIEATQTEIPYGVAQLEAPEIWKKGEQGEGIVDAILRYWNRQKHPCLKDQIIGGKTLQAKVRR